MDTVRVRSLAREILALSEPERQELAREVLPVLLTTRAGLAEIDASLRDLSDDELRGLVAASPQGSTRPGPPAVSPCCSPSRSSPKSTTSSSGRR